MLLFHKNSRSGQNMTEYMLMFAAAVAVMVVALNPKGFVTKAIDKSINMMFDSVEDMTSEQCLGTIDDVDGGWSDWGSWGACAGCMQTRTRGCTNPSPKCNGSPCSGPATETQTCPSGTWVTGICGACTGDCGDTQGSCTRLVTCPSGCCTSPAPASVLTCTKAEYPDEWNEFGFVGSCSTTCGQGIASQTVTCSGMCCDAKIKPHTRRACTDGCCAESLYAYTDVGTSPGPEDDTPVTANFGPTTNGQPFSVSCPFGYDGNPTRTCTATANLSCTGNDSYVPPPSCYNIGWSDPVSNTCVPAACDPSGLVDIGYGGYTLMYEFGGTNHGNIATVDCATLTDPNTGVRHTGYLGQPASYECWTKTWRNLNATCIPNCPAQTLDVGSGQTGEFLETVDGAIRNSSCPCGYASTSAPQRQCDEAGNNLGEWGNLIPGTECTIKQCPKETFSVVPEPPVTGDFGPVNHLQTSTLNCNNLDAPLYRFEGEVSRDCDWCTYDTNNGWGPQQGACSAKGCGPSGSYDIGGGLWASFDPIGHGQTQTINCNSKNNTYTGTATLDCAYGTWVDSSLVAGCRPFLCQNPFWPSNAQRCYDFGDTTDETGLTADTNWSLGEYGSCSAAKCEYACDQYHYKSGNNCSLATCSGSPPNYSLVCPGDESNLSADQHGTARHPVGESTSDCTSTTKCEYYCDTSNGYKYCSSGPKCYKPLTCADYNLCTSGSGTASYPLEGCGTTTLTCYECCGNGAIGGTEQCDGGSSSLPGNSWQCTTYNTYYGSSYNGGTLSCKSDCTFNTSNCCYAADGSWGGWEDYGSCGQYVACIQREHATTCSATCGGSCPNGGDYQDTKACGAVDGGWSGWDTCSATYGCGMGTQTRSCNNPTPSCGGASCSGSSSQSCDTGTCSATMKFAKGYTVTISYNESTNQWLVVASGGENHHECRGTYGWWSGSYMCPSWIDNSSMCPATYPYWPFPAYCAYSSWMNSYDTNGCWYGDFPCGEYILPSNGFKVTAGGSSVSVKATGKAHNHTTPYYATCSLTLPQDNGVNKCCTDLDHNTCNVCPSDWLCSKN